MAAMSETHALEPLCSRTLTVVGNWSAALAHRREATPGGKASRIVRPVVGQARQEVVRPFAAMTLEGGYG